MSVPLPSGITIAEVRSSADLEQWQAAYAAAWPGTSLDELPGHLLITHQRYGGLLLSAFDEEGHTIGVLLGFPGLKTGRVIHCSHLLGMVPAWRGRDIGYAMKLWQRAFVLAQGLDLIVWTFDPLETRNARLNLARLGGVCAEYNPNLYGPMHDGLNQGLDSDRLTVSWYIGHSSVEARLAGSVPEPDPRHLLADAAPLLTRTSLRDNAGGQPLLYLEDVLLGRDAPFLLVEAPAAFQAIKQAEFGAARAWREGLRAVFSDLFARGYGALHLLRATDDAGMLRCYYLFGDLHAYLEGTLHW